MGMDEIKTCYFCTNKVDEIDFRDVGLIRRFINQRGKIITPKRSGTCSKHQRKLATAIKRARTMALVPLTHK
jgi:small subunit ribosomal protein S18